MDLILQSSLSDLIRGLRQKKTSQREYLAQEIAKVQSELKSKEERVKSQAVSKAVYLGMNLGYDVSFCDFHIIELMSRYVLCESLSSITFKCMLLHF